jgi:hypothetical protein
MAGGKSLPIGIAQSTTGARNIPEEIVVNAAEIPISRINQSTPTLLFASTS